MVGLGEKGAHSYVDIDPEGDEALIAAADEEKAAIAAAEAVIKKLDVKRFSCHNFENPVLQKHFAVMQALALGEDDLSWKAEKDDNLLPDYAGMAKFTVRCVVPALVPCCEHSASQAELEAFRDAIGGDAVTDEAPKKRRVC